MGAEIDRLEVEVEASAAKANAELNKLINRLEKVSGTLQGINSSGLASFANGIESLGRSMQTVNSVKTSDFTRLVKNIQKVSSTDYTGLVKTASAMGSVARALNNTGAAMKSSESIVTLAGNIGKLGGKSIERAIINLPKLSAELKNLMTTLSQSPNVSKNVIQMTNALANLSDSLKGVRARSATASSGTKSFAKNLFSYSSSAQTATKRTLSLAAAFGKFYATYWLLIRGFGQLKKAIDISSDLTEVQNVVDVTFGKYRGMLEDLSSTSITEFGMSELTTKQIASRFQAMGTAMGFAQGQMADMSIGLTKLAADMASFYNVEQTDVAQDLEAIFTGQTRPLRTYGLDLTQATLQEWAMKQGIEANMKTMSQAEKTLLRYQYVLANTGAAQGDFARTSGTWANQTRILSQQFQALASTIGGVLINALKPFVTALNKVMAKVREFAKTVADALGAIFGWTIEVSGGGVADDFSDLAGSTDDLADNTGTAAGNLGDAADNAKKLRNYVLGFDELNILGDEDDSSKTGNSNGSGIGDIGGGYGSTGIVATESILEKYKSEIENLYQLGEYIGQALTDAMNSIDWDSIYAGARDFGTGLADFLNGLISPELFGATGRTIAGALNTAIYAALAFGETFDWTDFGLSIATGINEFFSTFDFASLAKTINVWVKGIYTTFKTAVGNIKWSEIARSIGKFLTNLDVGTVGIIIGYLTIKKILGLNIAGAVGTLISGKIAQLIASTLGVEIAKNARIGAALIAVGKSMGTTLFTGIQAALGSGSATIALLNPTASVVSGMTAINSLVTTITGITSVVGGVAITAKSFFSIWDEGFTVAKAVVIALGTALTALGAVMLGTTGPMGLAIAGIVTAITGLITAVKSAGDAIEDSISVSVFTSIKENGATSLEALGEVAENTFGQITDGADKTREKIQSISDSKESIDSTVDNIGELRTAIEAGAYTAEEKVPEIIKQFQSLLDESKSIFDEEYDVIVGNVVGAWADILTAQGQSIPEVVSGLLSMTDQGKQAYAELETSLNDLIEQYQNGSISAKEFYDQSGPLFEKLQSFNSDGSIDETTSVIQDLGVALDLSQYIDENSFDASAFQGYMDTVVQTATDGKTSLETLGEDNARTIADYQSQLEALGVDMSNFDFAALYGASEAQVAQGKSDIDAAYQDYADQVQYCLLQQLPGVVEEATAGYEDLGWWQKLFTTKESYVQSAVDEWKGNILTPATESIQSGFDELGIEGKTWAKEAATKLSNSLFDTFTEISYEGVETTTSTLKSNWKSILTNALSGAANAIDAESYGKDTVDGYSNGITQNAESSYKAIQDWMSGIPGVMHDSDMNFGSPSKTSEQFGMDTVLGFNKGIQSLAESTKEVINSWLNGVAESFNPENWYIMYDGMLVGFQTKWSEIAAWWDESIGKWWQDNVMPWFTVEKWLGLYDTVKTSLRTKWNEASSEWKSNINDWWNNNVTPWFTASRWLNAMSGIKEGFKESFKNAANAAIDVVNRLIRYLNEKLKIEWDSFTLPNGDRVGGFSKQLFRIDEISHFASGGYPETGELFLARENGINEMIGRIGSKSAVANNDQIVQAVSAGVSDAMMDVMMVFATQNNGNTNQIINEITIQADNETMYKIVKKGEELHDRRFHATVKI